MYIDVTCMRVRSYAPTHTQLLSTAPGGTCVDMSCRTSGAVRTRHARPPRTVADFADRPRHANAHAVLISTICASEPLGSLSMRREAPDVRHGAAIAAVARLSALAAARAGACRARRSASGPHGTSASSELRLGARSSRPTARACCCCPAPATAPDACVPVACRQRCWSVGSPGRRRPGGG